MVFTTCCLALSGVASAVDVYSFDTVNSSFAYAEAEDVSTEAEDVSTLEGISLFSVAASSQISSNNPISFGVSGGNSTSWQSGIEGYDYGDYCELKKFFLSASDTGVYLSVPSGTHIDVTLDVQGAYPDAKSLEFWGKANGQLAVYSAGGNLYLSPKKVSLLIDGVVVQSWTDVTSSFKYTHSIGVGDSVSSVIIRYFYPEHFDLMATANASNSRVLLFYPGDINTNLEQTQQGFFNSLFRWLADIRDGVGGVVNAVKNGLSNVVNSITELPGRIADAIKSLFVPTDAQMDELKASFNTLLSDKLGFVYQAGSLVDGVFDAVFDAVDNPNSDVSFTVPAFPSFDVAGTEVSLWEEPVVVDIADNEVVQTVQQVASPFVVAVMIWGFVHSMEDAFLAFVGGKSLADWVRNRKEDKD